MFKIAKKGVAVMLLIIVPLIASGVSSTTYAVTVPQYLGYEGYLTDANSDAALTGYYDMVFRIYDAETAGTLLWTETYSNVRAYTGYFSVQLGSSTALNLAFDDPYWISVQVGTDAEMTPRQPINSVGYSYRSDRTYGAYSVGSAPSSPTGGQIYYNSTSGKFYVYDAVGAVDWVDITTVGGLWFSGAHSTYTSGDDVVVGTSGDETITNSGFSLGGDDLFVAGDIGVEGTLYTDTGINTDTIGEATAGSGVTIDNITLKDGGSTVITGGTDTFNITNGTSSLDVVAGSALAVNANLTVESASIVNQDLTTDASVTFAGLSNADANITAVGDIALDSISSAGTHISIAATNSSDILQIGDGAYSWDHAPMVGIEGILEVDGATYFDGGFTAGGDLDMGGNDVLNVDQIVGNSTYITIGDASSPGRLGTPTNDDLYVSGRLEVDGNVYFDGTSVYFPIQGDFMTTGGGTTVASRFRYHQDDGFHFAVNTADNQANSNIIITSYNNSVTDHNHDTLSADPTLFIHSATAPTSNDTQWLSFTHDQTDGVIDVGTGTIKMNDSVGMAGNDILNVDQIVGNSTFVSIGDAAVGTSHSLNTNDDLLVEGRLEVNGTAYLDGITIHGATTRMNDNVGLKFGSGDDAQMSWNTNSTGDDLFVLLNRVLSANDTAAMFFTRDLIPAAMTDHDNYLSPTFVMTNDEGADANDYAGVVIGERAQADVTATHYFDFYAMTGAADGSVDATATELAATFRFGDSGATATTHSLGAGDVLINDELEVDGIAYFDGAVVLSSNVSIGDTKRLFFGGVIAVDQTVITGDMTADQFGIYLGSEQGRHVVIGETGTYNKDHDHAVQTNPTVFIHSALDPDTDNAEFLGLDYLGLSGGTMETDRAVFDMTLATVAPFATATGVKGDGADIILQTSSPNGGGTLYGIVSVGANANGHVDGTANSLFVAGKLEVDGQAFFDAAVSFGNSVSMTNNYSFDLGTGNSPGLQFDSTQTADSMIIYTGTASNSILITEREDNAFNFAHAQQTNPTVFIHSANQDTTQWLSFTHDQTDGVIQTGAGNLTIGDGADSRGLSTPNDLFVTGKLEVNGTWYLEGIGYVFANTRFSDGSQVRFGNGDDSSISYNTTQVPDALFIGVGTDSRGLLVAEQTDVGVNLAHAQETNPTIFVHSADATDTTQWLSFAHDQTDAVIAAGTGDIRFDTSIAVGRMELAADAGAVPLVDFEVSATPLQGEEESIGFAVDHDTILKVYAEADTAGGIQNESVKVKGTISTLTSGSSLTLDPLGASVVVATGTAFTPSGDQTMVDDAAVNCNDNTIARVTGNGADVVLDAAPAVTDGTNDGQMCIIQGTSDSLGTVQIADNVNTQLSAGGAFTLGKGDTLMLIWDAGDSDWYEVSRTDN